MPKITIIDVGDIGSQISNMTREELIQFYQADIDNPYFIEEYVDSIIKIIPFIAAEEEKILELIALKLSAENGIVFVISGGRDSVNLFLRSGIMIEKSEIRPIYERNISFNDITYNIDLVKDVLFRYEFVDKEAEKLQKYINLLDFMHELHYYADYYGVIDLSARAEKKVGKVANLIEEKKNESAEELPWVGVNGATSIHWFINNIIGLIGNYPDIFNSVIDIAEIKEIIEKKNKYNNLIAKQNKEIVSHELKETIRRHITQSRFGTKKLNQKENEYVTAQILKFEENDDFILNNKCAHIKLYYKLASSQSLADKKYWLGRLREFLPAEYEKYLFGRRTHGGGRFDPMHNLGIINCTVCSRKLLCSHILELINAMTYSITGEQISRMMKKYVNEDIRADRFYCKFCGEYLYDSESLNLSSNIGSGFSADPTEIEEILWREIRTLLNNVNFNIDTSRRNKVGIFQIDPQSFIRQGIATLAPWLEMIQRKEKRSKTITEEELAAILNIYAASYSTVLMVVLSINDPLIELNKPKITSRKTDALTKIIVEHVMNYKVNDIRMLHGMITTALLNTKVSAAYAVMYNAYKSGGISADNLTETFAEEIQADPIARQLKFKLAVNDIILSKNPNLYDSIIVPSYASIEAVLSNINLYSEALIRIYAEAYRAETWPIDIASLAPATLKLKQYRWINTAILIDPTHILPDKIADDSVEFLTKIFDDAGRPYKWTIFIYLIDEKEVEIPLNETISVPFGAILVDMKTKDGVKRSGLGSGNPAEILNEIKKTFELKQYYERLEFYCPAGNEHEFVDGICKKCGFNNKWLADSPEFVKFYEKRVDREQENSTPTNIDKEPVETPQSKEEPAAEIKEQIAQIVFKWEKNPLIIKEFADHSEFDIKKITVNDTIASRDDPRVISIISLLQKMLTEYRDFQIAADKSKLVPITNGPNLIEYYRNMVSGNRKLADIDPSVLGRAEEGRMIVDVGEVYSFLIELLCATFIHVDSDFCKDQMSHFIRMNETAIRPESWDKWESATPTIIKVMSAETAEDKTIAPDVNDVEISTQDADIEGVNVAFGNEYDLDDAFDNEDNVERDVDLD